ncbi:flagellar hook-associated protein FlgK [Alteromonas ponticola]|uniref:Flagellar hook-associated protein 1 n=1 Tax=Alteromonas aquimaris TaxID=2998417 RepID=A0ABT3P4A8_9ALTE|nr:flagellar hook-associated protein FlgK [Alteromonas aquimaris]MCW8107583.1 flagellar hook-associated protein FlgK [Alteromonas aquimaris]
MVRPVDMFNIAKSGINASSTLLQTTSKNIANVNTEGYVRERTTFEGGILGGVGEPTTERVIDVFAQNQLRRDITKVGEFEVYQQKASAIDNLLASDANSIAQGLSEFFGSLQTAADDPSNLSSRELVLAQGRDVLRRFGTVSDFLEEKEKEVNLEFTSMVNRANDLIKNIGELNNAIQVASGDFGSAREPTTLMNQRDKSIDELAELMAIEVNDSKSEPGSVNINLKTGESLVLDDGSFNLIEISSDADLGRKQLQLSTEFSGAKNDTKINLGETSLGGQIGGLFRYRDEILAPTQRDIGQMALAFADAVNSQNNLGMDLDFQLGGNIFNLPEFVGVNYPGTPNGLPVTGRVTPGSGELITDADYKVTVTSVTAGVPDEVQLEMLNNDGTPKMDASGNPVVYTGITVGAGFSELPGGLEIDFEAAGGYSVGNEFLFQPTKYAAADIELATDRPQDLAFASPLRVQPDSDNLGTATVRQVTVTNTTVDPALGADASAFDGAGGIHGVAGSPSATVGAPAEILFTSPTDYQVLDSAGNVITNVSGVSDYDNLLAQAEASGATPSWPASFSALDDYPGYDLSLSGSPRAGDSFTLSYNANGVNDNTNALKMINLQDEKLVQVSSDASNEPRTLFDAFSSVVGNVGEKAASADISLEAAEAMKSQSQEWFDSVSGVSLDEEAANLIRFQQSYAAAARILSTAQDMFETILSAAR